MRRQAKLVGGPLCGEMFCPNVSGEEMTALLKNPKGLGETFGADDDIDRAYEGIANRVIKALQPRLSAFVSTLRNQYGQYWLQEVPSIDVAVLRASAFSARDSCNPNDQS
jgi:hypothetical protein